MQIIINIIILVISNVAYQTWKAKSTFLEEVHRLGPLSGGWDWQSSSDLPGEPTKVLGHRSGISRLLNTILKTPVVVTLSEGKCTILCFFFF